MAEDDYYYDDDGIGEYESTAVDPSYYFLLFTGVFCVITNLMLPCFVSWGRRCFGAHKVELPEEKEGREHELEEKQDPKEEEEEGQEVSIGASSVIGSQQESQASARSASQLQEEEHKLTQGVLARFTTYYDPYSRSAVPSAVSHVSRSTAMSMSSSVFDSGFIAPVRRGGRGGRRMRGAVARHRAQQLEYFNSIRNQQFEEMEGPPPRPQTEYAASEAAPSVVSSRRPQSLPGGPIRRKKHVAANTSVWRHGHSEIDVADLEPDFIEPDEPAIENLALEDVDICCGERAWWKPSVISRMFDALLRLAEYDADSRRLVQLAMPLSISEVISGIWELVIVSLIAHFIGTRAVAAYTVTDLFIGLTEELVGGIVDTVGVLSPHALGAGNNVLAGQYVQIAALIYAGSMVPVICIWLAFTDDLMLLLGFDQETARIAQEYVNIAVFSDLVEGIMEAYTNFLYCIDMEKFLTVMDIAEEFIVGTILVLILTLKEDTTLTEVALIYLLMDLAFSVITIAYPVMRGWLRDYLTGMVGTFALKNVAAVKRAVKTAIPLCVGQLLAYGEWEVLTLFVAHLGPAETAAWGILGVLWSAVEATSSGFADAGEVRVAYHLGAGRPNRAKTSGYKCIIISFAAACLITSILFIFGENLALWVTSDPVLQRIIVDLIPLVGLGNVTLTAGSVSWSLVGAQGRYRLATILFAATSWGVTLPLAALFTYAFNINLQGVTAAVVIGYSVAGTALSYVLILSDWDGLSKVIVAENAVDESESDEEEDESSVEQSSLRSFTMGSHINFWTPPTFGLRAASFRQRHFVK